MITTIGTRLDGTKFRADPARIHTYTNCRMETREPTPEEIEELRIPLAIVEVAIPEQVYLTAEVQQLIGGFRTIYSGLDIRTYGGYTHIGNVDLGDIKKFISKEVYDQMKGTGTIRPPEVDALFATPENNEEPNPEPTPADSGDSSEPASDAGVNPADTDNDRAENTEESTEEISTP